MFQQFMTETSLAILNRAFPSLATELTITQKDADYWVCYGSFVLGQQRPGSDIDLLYVHNECLRPPCRIQSSFEEWPVTIYALNATDLRSDGKQRRYGGYFGAKLINPNAVFSPKRNVDAHIMEVVGGFFGEIAATIGRKRGVDSASADNIAADCFLAMLHICPWYEAYFARYFMDPRFPEIWNMLQKGIIQSMLHVRELTELSRGYFEYRGSLDTDSFHAELVRINARFWAAGVHFHAGRLDFPDYYFDKSARFMRESVGDDTCKAMYDFLHKKAQ